MTKSLTGRTATFLLRELVGEILYFPVWWYSQGLRLAWQRLIRQWARLYNRLGLRFLFANMGKPMYGDYTRSGKVISFFFRLFLVGWSMLVMLFGGALAVFIFLAWIITPLVVMALLVRQIIPIEIYV
jgi:hypothetical protein